MKISTIHLIWIILALFNLIIQISYFLKDDSSALYLGKRMTTPALLFSGMAMLLYYNESSSFLPILLLGLMGLGEIGIEGSSVVEDRGEKAKPSVAGNVMVTVAGIIFLAVNIILGLSLFPHKSFHVLAVSFGISLAVFFLINQFLELRFKPDRGIKFQTRIYSLGLIVLFTGALADLYSGLSSTGLAAIILSISDTLVLIRMSAGFDKSKNRERYILFGFLVIILLLYYFYMAVLINSGNPF
ncbi:MAG: hypothetical protein JXR48_15620 [Candidatus Delongbacteria bacterium]|nr:hypothetical protein [Candidatus Delongbacteria bacterium]